MNIPLCDNEKFEAFVATKLDALKDYYNMPISLTGNPFVDTGLIVIAIQAGVQPTELTLEILVENYRNGAAGADLSKRNYSYKGTSMIFSTNTPLLQPGFTPKKPKHQCYKAIADNLYSPLAEHIYRTYLINFLNSIPIKSTQHSRCMICNEPTELNFYEIDKSINNSLPNPKKGKFTGGLSRLWFPLMGTIGSEAQAFPGFTEQPVVCGKCLFAVQYIPQAARLFQGKLALYQTSNLNLWIELIRDNVTEFDAIYSAGTQKKMELLGKKEHQGTFLLKLIEIIARNWESLNVHNLILWLFVSSGQNVDVEITQLPDKVLKFLYELTQEKENEETLTKLLTNEKKVSYDNTFLARILAERDYKPLYADTKHAPIPRAFYDLYQISITETDPAILDFVREIARILYTKLTKSKVIDIIKTGKTSYNDKLKQELYPIILDHIRTLQDKSIIFYWMQSKQKWNLFDYYLHPQVDRTLFVTDLYESKLDIFQFSDNLKEFNVYAHLYRQREQKRSTYSFDKSLAIDNIYRKIDSIFMQLAREYSGYTWQKHELLKAELKVNYHSNKDITLIFQTLLLESQNTQDFIIPMQQIENIRALEAQNMISEMLLHDIYEYILQRKIEMKTFRGISDLISILNRGKYSFNGFLLFLRKKGIFSKEEAWYATYTAGNHISGNKWGRGSSIYTVTAESADRFSWTRVKQQLLVFLYQLTFLNNWQEQLTTRLTELFPEVEL